MSDSTTNSDREWEQWEQWELPTFPFLSCPDVNEMTDTDAYDSEMIREHLQSGCPYCTLLLANLRTAIAAAGNGQKLAGVPDDTY